MEMGRPEPPVALGLNPGVSVVSKSPGRDPKIFCSRNSKRKKIKAR